MYLKDKYTSTLDTCILNVLIKPHLIVSIDSRLDVSFEKLEELLVLRHGRHSSELLLSSLFSHFHARVHRRPHLFYLSSSEIRIFVVVTGVK